jgi:hypothetical protein
MFKLQFQIYADVVERADVLARVDSRWFSLVFEVLEVNDENDGTLVGAASDYSALGLDHC